MVFVEEDFLPMYGYFIWKIRMHSYLYSSKAADCLFYVSFFTYLLRRDLSHQFCEFKVQHFLVNFSVKAICFILITQVQYPSRGTSN